ncbi:MAG: polysaccharide deacetylase family protein [Bacillota bacterium]|nr:polysaccharide deacetylase family protein [Bacillota bacterium]
MKFFNNILKNIIYFFVSLIFLLFSNFSLVDSNSMSVFKPVGLDEEVESIKTPKTVNDVQEKETQSQKKVAFLTFDDGPCINNTLKILNILDKNNIKATFFIVGKKAEEYPDILKKLFDDGMCILPHTYSHEYKIYKNKETYHKDLMTCIDCIKKITNKDVIKYTRFPGGSFNAVSNKNRMREIRESLKEENMKYVDWNVSSGDALGDGVAAYKIKRNVINQCKNKDIAVILFHDAYYKKTTVEALPDIIKNLKDSGFIFKSLNDITPEEEDSLVKAKVINR